MGRGRNWEGRGVYPEVKKGVEVWSGKGVRD